MTTVQNPQRTLELAAQGLANLGYKEAALTTASFGALQLRDREGNVISTLDYRTPLNRAWLQALQALSEQGIDITPEWAQKPFLAQIKTSSDDTQNLGIYITPEKLVVKAWMVDLGSFAKWYKPSTSGPNLFATSVPNWMNKSRNAPIVSTFATSANMNNVPSSMVDNSIGFNNTLLFLDSRYTEASQLTKYNNELILVELATPIEILFDSPLNFDFPRVNDTDILSVLDIDGEEMFRIQSGEVDEAYCTQYNLPSDLATKHALWTDLFPNPEWVKSHNTLPGLLILDNLRGIGRRFDVKYLLSLEQRLQALEDKLK